MPPSQLRGRMLWFVAIIGWRATFVQAFAPVPIWWRSPKRSYVLAPIALPAKASPGPQTLKIWDQLQFGSILPNEIPRFAPQSDDTIVLDTTKLCMQASGYRSADAVFLNRCTGQRTQLWNFLPGIHGRNTQIQLKATNKCIDVQNTESSLNGAPVVLQDCHNEATDTWAFEEMMPLPSEAPTRNQSPARSLKPGRVLSWWAAVAGLSALGAFGFFSLLWRRRKRSLVASVSRGGVNASFSVDQGGVVLPLVTPRGMRPTTASLRPPENNSVDPTESERSENGEDLAETSVVGDAQMAGFQPLFATQRFLCQSASRTPTPLMSGNGLAPSFVSVAHDAGVDEVALSDGQAKPKTMTDRFELQFTCNVCETKNTHSIGRHAYTRGSVMVTCPGCKSMHLIADNLNWFSDDFQNVEEFMKKRGTPVTGVVSGGVAAEAAAAAEKAQPAESPADAIREAIRERRRRKAQERVEAWAAAAQKQEIGLLSAYATLGVDPDSSDADIKRVYREQCLLHHPDNGGDEARFKELAFAYEKIIDLRERGI